MRVSPNWCIFALVMSVFAQATVAQPTVCSPVTLKKTLDVHQQKITVLARENVPEALRQLQLSIELFSNCRSALSGDAKKSAFLQLFATYTKFMRTGAASPSELQKIARDMVALAELSTGEGSEETGVALDNLAGVMRRMGDREQSLKLQRKVAEIITAHYGPEHNYLGSILNDIALDLDKLGRHAEATPIYERVVSIHSKNTERDNPDLRTALHNLAVNLDKRRDYEKALATYQSLLRVTEAASGPDSTDVAETLIEIAGILHFHLFRLQEAEVVLARLLSLREKLHDANHPAVALALNYLAQLQTDLHKFSVSEPLLLRALAIQEGRLEPDHLNVALTLNNLSVLYFKLGRFTQAEPLIRRTIAIREKQLGRDDPATTLSLDNLARNLNQQGRHSEADTIYREVLAIREKTLGGDPPEVANSLINLAGTLYEMRRMHELEPLYSRALSISENGLGADHPDVADVLSSFGAALAELGRCPEALPLQRRAPAIRERRLHDNHPSIAISLNNISACVSPAEAEPLQMRALQITQKAYGVAHPEVAIRLHQLASNYHTQRRYLDADATYRRALEVRLATLPKHHPSVALTLNNLAALKYDEGNWLEAVEFARRAGQVAIDRARLTSAMTEKPMSGAAEAEPMRGTAEFNWLIRSAWRLAQQQPSTLRELTEETFAAAQRSAQTSAGSAVAQMAARFARGSGELSSLVREQQTISALLREFDKRIVALRSEAPDKRPEGLEASITRQTMDAEQRLTSVTSRLAKDFPEYAAVSAPEPLTMQMVQNYLRSDEALVLFGFVGSETHLWAINTDAVRWVRLPVPTQKIEEIVPALRCGLDQSLWNGMESFERCRVTLGAVPSAETVTVGDKDERVQVLPFDLARAHELYKALLEPAADLIKGKRLIIVPSGPLTSVPFNVLVTEPPKAAIPSTLAAYREASWLGARTAITVLPSVASLKALRQFAKTSHAARPYLGIGNPLLDGPTDDRQWGAHYKKQAQVARDKQQCPKSLAQRIALAVGRPLTGFPRLFRGAQTDIEEVRQWTPLPETADELCAVGRRLGAPESDIILGANATEAKLKELSGQGRLADYAILHFATHGALTGQVQGSAEPGLILTPPPKGTSDPKALELDDGFLTASEIATLKLDADWVVLSACNTAGAQSESAEALSGMARAFFYAGARALLVSHWEVGSEAAVKLTTRAFAELRLNPKVGRAEAFRVSMRELIEKGSLAEAHPAMWAPFAVVGEGR